jgi:hypothetical protein
MGRGTSHTKYRDSLEYIARPANLKKRDPIIKKGYKVSILYKKQKQQHYRNNAVCPNCHTPVFFWTDGEVKNHFCTICHKEATL